MDRCDANDVKLGCLGREQKSQRIIDAGICVDPDSHGIQPSDAFLPLMCRLESTREELDRASPASRCDLEELSVVAAFRPQKGE
jgi:hypothetical protein